MQVSEDHINYLWGRYIDKKATDQELEELFALLEHAGTDEMHQKWLLKLIDKTDRHPLENELWEPVLSNILKSQPSKPAVHRIHFLKTSWFRYAAAVILVCGASFYLLSNNKRNNLAETSGNGTATLSSNIIPGGNKAVLTLADGSHITLDSASTGDVALQGQSRIIKLNEGFLTYESPTGSLKHATEISFNSISTPRGGQYQVRLPDGTKVNLNAASSIRFPTAFTGSRREVMITGEVYFEVAPDAQKPFYVKVNDRAEVEVLGTSFNINAYDDEPVIKATLLTGSIKVKNSLKGNAQLLVPNEEWTLREESAQINKVDVTTSVAWIHGMFNFKSADLQMVMRQISRWYNVDIKYEGIVNGKFSGSMYRSENLSELLKIIAFTTRVKFAMNQNNLIVSPK